MFFFLNAQTYVCLRDNGKCFGETKMLQIEFKRRIISFKFSRAERDEGCSTGRENGFKLAKVPVSNVLTIGERTERVSTHASWFL